MITNTKDHQNNTIKDNDFADFNRYNDILPCKYYLYQSYILINE